MADVPIAKIAKILGHKELMTTQRYAHLADRSLFEAVERIVQSVHAGTQ
jgi:site-specific recombinase XerD